MKKIVLTISGLLSLFLLKAQEPADALRFSWAPQSGTARVQAIGGAMGSLGGDITATFVNPAGLGFYKTGDIVLTPQFRFGNAKSNYLNHTEKEKGNKFTWGTTGILIGGGDGKGNIRSSALSIVYNRSADFNTNVLYRGINTQSSYSQKFLEQIQRDNIKDGNTLATGYPNGASLAFNTFWIDTVGGGTNGNFQFQSRSANILASEGSLYQSQTLQTRGGIDEFAIGFGVNNKDKLFFGGTLGIPVLHFGRETVFREEDPTDNPNNHFDFAEVTEKLTTNGVGLNLKAGLIYKPTEFWRFGLAFHSPTWYSLTDKYETYITTDPENGQFLSDYSRDYNGGDPSEFKYTFYTPYKAVGSISYVIREIQDVTKQKGFLTADVEYVNYKASAFHAYEDEDTFVDESTKDYLKQLNKAIDNAYKGAFNFRVGGELKFTTIMARLGAAFYGNPYKNINGEKGSRLNLTGGLGYRNKGFFVDLTYVHSMNQDVHYAYRLTSAPYSAAKIKNNVGNVLLTFGIKI